MAEQVDFDQELLAKNVLPISHMDLLCRWVDEAENTACDLLEKFRKEVNQM